MEIEGFTIKTEHEADSTAQFNAFVNARPELVKRFYDQSLTTLEDKMQEFLRIALATALGEGKLILDKAQQTPVDFVDRVAKRASGRVAPK